LVPQAKKQENNTLKLKVTIVAMQHFIKKLFILLFSKLKLFEVVIILRKFRVCILEKTLFKKVTSRNVAG
jgi:hypothetical protein